RGPRCEQLPQLGDVRVRGEPRCDEVHRTVPYAALVDLPVGDFAVGGARDMDQVDHTDRAGLGEFRERVEDTRVRLIALESREYQLHGSVLEGVHAPSPLRLGLAPASRVAGGAPHSA